MSWYQIQMKGEKEAEILIYEQIGEGWVGDGIVAKKFAEDLKALGSVSTLNIRINSPGGQVWDGFAIYNTLMAHRAKKNVFVDGVAASIASVIAMAGDTITMPDTAMMMIHNPATIALGDAAEMRKAAEMLDKVKINAIAAYHRKSGMETDEISRLMDEETWLLAGEAVSLGFADTVSGSVPAMNSAAISMFDFSNFNRSPVLGSNNFKGETTMSIPEKYARTTQERVVYPRAINEWDSDPALHREFGEFDTYFAYRVATSDKTGKERQDPRLQGKVWTCNPLERR